MQKRTELCPVCGRKVLDVVAGGGSISVETKCPKCRSIILIELQCETEKEKENNCYC